MRNYPVANLLGEFPNRSFLAPREVITGDNSTQSLGMALKNLGCGRGVVAVIVDESVLRLGLAKDAFSSLKEAGFEPSVVAAVSCEPTVEDARKALVASRRLSPKAVIGIGGGSALDLAKLMAVAAHGNDAIEAYFSAGEGIARSLPLVAVPTTAGTGAEATRVSMITEDGRKKIVAQKALVPDLVVLDPLMVASLPSAVTAATGLDALCHAIEALLSTNRSPLSIVCSLEALRLVSASLRNSYLHPDSIKWRRGMLYGAYLAGLGLNAGVVLGHSIGYTIANRKHVAHGITCAIGLPYCIRYNIDKSEDVVSMIAKEVVGELDIDRLVRWLYELNSDLRVPDSLSELGVQSSDLDEMALECVEKYPRPNNPEPMTAGGIRRLYDAMFHGDKATTPIH